MDVTIDYCSDCNHRDEALEATRVVLNNFEERLESLELVPAEGGVFRISIGGQVVFDLDDNTFSGDKIVEAVDEFLEEQEEDEVSDS